MDFRKLLHFAWNLEIPEFLLVQLVILLSSVVTLADPAIDEAVGK